MKRLNLFTGGLWLLIVSFLLVELAAQPSRLFQFEVSETAGIRRRSDVVSTRLLLKKPVAAGVDFRLELGDQKIPCQFNPLAEPDGRISAVDIDFVGHFQPWETRRYQLQVGVDLAGVNKPGEGLTVEESASEFRIKNRDYLVWTVRKDLGGLLKFLKTPDVQYVSADSGGLGFRTSDDQFNSLSEKKPSRVRILRDGPISAALEFEYANWPPGSSGKVLLEFPRTKSWVHVRWTVQEADRVSELAAELRLALDGEEKLVDFGAGDYVYNTLRANQVAVLEAGYETKPPWAVYHGNRGKIGPLVVAREGSSVPGQGGWVHLMDDTRCTAAAVARFGEVGIDRIEVDGTGLLKISHKPPDDRAVLEFWIHFVRMPVQIGARTSPQSMQSPLVVKWLPTAP